MSRVSGPVTVPATAHRVTFRGSQHPTLRHAAGTALVALLALSAGAAPASAQGTTTVNFNGLTVTDGSGVRYVGNCYEESGFRILAVGLGCGVPNVFATGGAESPLFWTGSPALFLNDPAATAVDFVRIGGGTFGLTSIGLAPFLGSTTSVMLTGTRGDGSTVTQTLSVPGSTMGLASFTITGFTGLTGVRLAATNVNGEQYVQFDNLVFSAAATTVPEPGTIALTFTGLLGLGAVVRRRASGDRASRA